MEKIVLRGHCASPGKAEGKALVSYELFGIGGLMPLLGITPAASKSLAGEYLPDKILVMPNASGVGVSLATYLVNMTKQFGGLPQGIVASTDFPYSMTVISAIISETPMVYNLDKDPLEIIETGDFVKMDAGKGVVEVYKKERR